MPWLQFPDRWFGNKLGICVRVCVCVCVCARARDRERAREEGSIKREVEGLEGRNNSGATGF